MKGRIKAGKGSLIGNAGEHYVMAELLKRGIVAALAPRNAPSFDILATKGNQAVRIRVKTKSQEYSAWQWNVKKDGGIFRDLSRRGDFTVLVDLAKNIKDLKFYIIPTALVDKWLKDDFKNWVKQPGQKGQPHDPTSKKRMLWQNDYAAELNRHLNRWGKLWKRG